MKRFGIGLVIACAVALGPADVSAALSLQFGNGNGPLGRVIGPLPPPGGPYFVDLVFVETGAPDDEGLFAYDLGVNATPGGPVRLIGAEKPDNWVFTNPNAALIVAQATPSRLIINATDAAPGDLPDITTGMKAARVLYTIDCDRATTFFSTVGLDPQITVFGSGDPNHDLEIPVSTADGTAFICPEPTGVTLLGVAALLGLRRRRLARR
jgi:hypothetical protein